MFSCKNKAKSFAFGFWLLAFGFFKAQVNYVLNPSFEKLDSCVPDMKNGFIWPYVPGSLASPWDTLANGGGGSTILCHTCFNPNPNVSVPTNFAAVLPPGLYQETHSGQGYIYMGFLKKTPVNSVNWRAYIQQKMERTLLQNKKYCVTYYASLSNRYVSAVDELGAYFDDGSIQSIAPLKEAIVNPQIKSPTGVFYTDTLNWMKVQGTFMANGNERYITIGNFRPTATSNFTTFSGSPDANAEYYIDDVSVIEADLPAYAGRDTVLCTGDSLFIGRTPEIGLECLWYNNNTQINNIAGFWVKPAVTQTYAVVQDMCGIMRYDTIQVQVKPKFIGVPKIQSSSLALCPKDMANLTVINTPTLGNIYNWKSNLSLNSNSNYSVQAIISNTIIAATNYNIYLTLQNNGAGLFCPFNSKDSVTIQVSDTCFKEVVIPNIFTPNDDKINDSWRFKMPLGVTLNLIEVYNRWGTLIYTIDESLLKTNDLINTINWDGHTTSGEVCGSGVYFYLIKYTDRFKESKIIKGNLSLVR